LRLSEDIFEKTIQYSNQILEGTIPLSKTIFENSLKSSELISYTLSSSPQFKSTVNIEYRDEIKTSTIEMENKLDSLSTITNDRMTNISDNIAKDILSI